MTSTYEYWGNIRGPQVSLNVYWIFYMYMEEMIHANIMSKYLDFFNEKKNHFCTIEFVDCHKKFCKKLRYDRVT